MNLNTAYQKYHNAQRAAVFVTVLPLHLLFFFLSIARYMPSDFWMESLVMKLTKPRVSDSLLDINLSTVCFLIMDLVICLAWSVIKELGQSFVLFFFLNGKPQKSPSTSLEFYQKLQHFTAFAQWSQSSDAVVSSVQHTWNSQPFGHCLCGCGDDLVFRDQLVHQSNL